MTDAAENIKLDNDTVRLLVSLLYLCEGTKYQNSTVVSFVNSDARLLKTFLVLFHKAFKLDESKFRVHLQLHTIHDQNQVEKFWSEFLGIPMSQFYKPTITAPTGTRYRKEHKGTCSVRYNDYRLVLKMMGITEKFMERCRNW